MPRGAARERVAQVRQVPIATSGASNSAAARSMSRPGGVSDVLGVVRRPALATGRKSKMPPPSLSMTTIGQVAAQAPAGQQGAEVVGEGDVAEQGEVGRGGAGGQPVGGRQRAVDAVGAAVGEHARRRRRARARTSRRRAPASRTRPGRVRVGRHRGRRARRRRRARDSSSRSTPSERGGGAGVGGAPAWRPAVLARSAARRGERGRPGPARSERGHDAGRVLPGALGVQRHCASPSRPASHVRSGLEVGRSPDAQDEVGRHRRGEPASRSSAS